METASTDIGHPTHRLISVAQKVIQLEKGWASAELDIPNMQNETGTQLQIIGGILDASSQVDTAAETLLVWQRNKDRLAVAREKVSLAEPNLPNERAISSIRYTFTVWIDRLVRFNDISLVSGLNVAIDKEFLANHPLSQEVEQMIKTIREELTAVGHA